MRIAHPQVGLQSIQSPQGGGIIEAAASQLGQGALDRAVRQGRHASAAQGTLNAVDVGKDAPAQWVAIQPGGEGATEGCVVHQKVKTKSFVGRGGAGGAASVAAGRRMMTPRPECSGCTADSPAGTLITIGGAGRSAAPATSRRGGL